LWWAEESEKKRVSERREKNRMEAITEQMMILDLKENLGFGFVIFVGIYSIEIHNSIWLIWVKGIGDYVKKD
jgi:hypothetical protein